jgi:hypothetical protein
LLVTLSELNKYYHNLICNDNEIWKNLFIERFENVNGHLPFDSWREIYISTCLNCKLNFSEEQQKNLKCRVNLFSFIFFLDIRYHSWDSNL